MTPATTTAAVTLWLALPAATFGLATETFGNAPAVRQPDWAEGVLEVVNLKSRVYARWVNGNENFYYQGGARDLNEALRRFAAVKADVRPVVLLPGSGETKAFAGKAVPFDWHLHVPSGIYKGATGRNHAVLTVYLNATRPRPLGPGKVERWLRDLDSETFAVREKAQEELKKLGTDAKPFLRAALKAGPMPEARRRIEGLLEQVGGLDVTDLEIPEGVALLSVDELLAARLKELKDPDATVCGMAAQDLRALAPYSDKVVPALTGLLAEGKNEWIRRVAAGCLGSLGAQAKSALPALQRGLEDPDPNVRGAFRAASEQIEKAEDPPGQKERLKKERAILKDINEFKKARPAGPKASGSRTDRPE